MKTKSFIVTQEHRRFCEFADTVRAEKTIGICYGAAGIGKTLSARRYTHWDTAETLLVEWGPRKDSDSKVYSALAKKKAVFYNPPVIQSPKQFMLDLNQLTTRVDACISQHQPPARPDPHKPAPRTHIELIVIDEAERLAPKSLEILRDQYDREHRGIILIGMTGLVKRFSRYPQLYSRVGFAHKYRALSQQELCFVLKRQWHSHSRTLDLDDFTDDQAITTIAQLTRGNFRLLQRLLTQIERVLKINDLHTVTNDVVEAARSTLVIGTT